MNRDANASGVGTGRSSIPCLALAAALLVVQPQAAHARTFNVPCDDAALLAVLGTVETNGEEDVLWLAESCTYTLDLAWIVDADGGFPEGYPVTVHGRATTISGSEQHPVFVVNPTAVLFLEGVNVADGASTGDGGAIQNLGVLTLTDSTVSSSTASRGAGIVNFENGRLTLVRSTVSGNTAGVDGGGIFNRTGRVTLIDSTVSDNAAQGQNGNGGGIYSVGENARVTLLNSTIAGNASRFGAGVFNDEGVMVVNHATITGNTALVGGNGAGVYHRNDVGGGLLVIGNSIVANGVFPAGNGFDCVRDPVFAVVIPSGTNLVEDGSCELGGLAGDPRLGAPTGTPVHFPLQPDSPAVDTGGLYECAGHDQRGGPRPLDGNQDSGATCDLGAYELALP